VRFFVDGSLTRDTREALQAGLVATIVLGFIILGETMTLGKLAGALRVGGGVLLVTI